MITNGLTPAFGSKPLSWVLLGYFSVPQVRSLYPISAHLAILLKSTPACSRALPWMLFADRPAGVWVSFCPARPLFVCFRGHEVDLTAKQAEQDTLTSCGSA